jgi:hypothetical protein
VFGETSNSLAMATLLMLLLQWTVMLSMGALGMAYLGRVELVI